MGVVQGLPPSCKMDVRRYYFKVNLFMYRLWRKSCAQTWDWIQFCVAVFRSTVFKIYTRIILTILFSSF